MMTQFSQYRRGSEGNFSPFRQLTLLSALCIIIDGYLYRSVLDFPPGDPGAGGSLEERGHAKMATIDLSKYGITGVTEIVYNPSYETLFE